MSRSATCFFVRLARQMLVQVVNVDGTPSSTFRGPRLGARSEQRLHPNRDPSSYAVQMHPPGTQHLWPILGCHYCWSESS